ncbi:unnamed protein product [Cunninghamella echinulata]
MFDIINFVSQSERVTLKIDWLLLKNKKKKIYQNIPTQSPSSASNGVENGVEHVLYLFFKTPLSSFSKVENLTDANTIYKTIKDFVIFNLKIIQKPLSLIVCTEIIQTNYVKALIRYILKQQYGFIYLFNSFFLYL